MTPLALDSETKAAFQAQGYARLGTLLDEGEVEALRARLDALEQAPGAAGVIVHNLWRREPLVSEVVTSRVLSSLAAALLEEARVVLFQDNLVWKTPGATAIEWHQDYSYQPLSDWRGVTTWLSLDETSPETGCMHFLPGTHLLGERAPADFLEGSNQPQRDLPPLDWEARRDQIVAVPTRPGELVAHHPLVWHMSPPNASQQQRRALSINWIHPQTRWKPSQAPHPFNYELKPADGDPFDPELFPTLPR